MAVAAVTGDTPRTAAGLPTGIWTPSGLPPAVVIEYTKEVLLRAMAAGRTQVTVSGYVWTYTAIDAETGPGLDVERLNVALHRAWPRTFGNRTSWSQPSIDMAVHIAAEYARLTPTADPAPPQYTEVERLDNENPDPRGRP